MKFLILFFLSFNLFSLEINEIKFHLSNIAIGLESPTVTPQEKENALNRLMKMYQDFMRELSGWDEDHLAIAEDMLNQISSLLLEHELVYTRTTLDQLMDALEGYLMCRDNQTPLPQVVVDLLRRAYQEIVTQDLVGHMAALARLIQGEHGTDELRAAYNNLHHNHMRSMYEEFLLRTRRELQVITDNDHPMLENRDIIVWQPQDNEERIRFINRIVMQLLQDQDDMRRHPSLEPLIQNIIRMLVRGMDRLTDTERNELINLIQTRLHRSFWEVQRDIQWYRAPQISEAKYTKVASNMRNMR